MPEVLVRRRLGRRAGGWKYQLDRWFYRQRPRIAVAAAFAIACVLGLIAASMGLEKLGAASTASAEDAPPAATQ